MVECGCPKTFDSECISRRLLVAFILVGVCKGSLIMFFKVNLNMYLYPQLTATTRPKPVAKVRALKASLRVHTLPALPAQAHTGEMTALHLINPLTGAT